MSGETSAVTATGEQRSPVAISIQEPTSVKDAAQAYALRGFAVLPLYGIINEKCACGNPDCCSPGKHPRTKRGLNDASKDPKAIDRMFGSNSTSGFNVGIATGEVSGFWALDIDGPDGETSLRDLEATHGALPATLEQRTGRGRHLLFAWRGSVKSSAQELGSKLDVRGDGGYIVAAPSTHHSGGQYEFIDPEAEIADAPDWLEDLVRKSAPRAVAAPRSATSTSAIATSPYGLAALDEECLSVANAPDGKQETTLNSAALKIGALVAGGEVNRDEATEALIDAGMKMQNFAEPWRPDHIEAKVERGLSDGARSPRSSVLAGGRGGISSFNSFSRGAAANSLEPPRPLMRELPPATEYPVEALGPVMCAAALGIHDKTQAAVALCAQSVLTTAALAVQNHHDVTLPTGQQRPTSIFAVSVAQSGDRKSSADDLAIWPIARREQVLREQYDIQFADYENDRVAYEKVREAAQRANKSDRAALRHALAEVGPAPMPHLQPMLTAPEPTFEGLCKLLTIGQPGVGVFSGEGGQFIGGHAMNQDNRIKTAAGLSTLWDSGTAKRVRAGDGTQTLVGRRVSMHLMAQPGVAAEMLGDDTLADQGLLSRILVAAPNSPAGTRTWREPSQDSERATKRYGAKVLALLEAPLPVQADKPNELAPTPLTLSPKARQLWIAFADDIERQIGPGGPLGPVRGLANKIPEHAARIAAIIHTMETGAVGPGEIGPDFMAAGIDIAQYHLAEAQRLFEAAKIGAELSEAKKVLDWLQSTGKGLISLPDIYQLGPNSVRTKQKAKAVVLILLDHGWLEEAGPNSINGVERQETFRFVRVQ